jgi:transcriptional regulator with XRE-family HTH domain
VARPSLTHPPAPTPFGLWIQDLGRQHNWTSQRQAAKYLGVDPKALNTWMRGEYAPSIDYQRHLAQRTGEPLEAIAELVAASKPATDQVSGAALLPARLTREFARTVADELAHILASGETLPVASAGTGSPADLDAIRPQIMRIRGEIGLQRGPLVAFEVVGDCLEPRLRPGWIAWVNPEAVRRPGDVVLALVDGEQMFKQFDRDRETGREWLTALNGRAPIPVDESVRIQGVVQLVQHAP